MPANQTEPETYTIDDTIRVPVVLKDEEGVAHVRAIFRRLRRPGNLGPRGLDRERVSRPRHYPIILLGRPYPARRRVEGPHEGAEARKHRGIQLRW